MFDFCRNSEGNSKPKEITIGSRDIRKDSEKCRECMNFDKTYQECVDIRCIHAFPTPIDQFKSRVYLYGGDFNKLCKFAAVGLNYPFLKQRGLYKDDAIDLIRRNLCYLSDDTLAETKDILRERNWAEGDKEKFELLKEINKEEGDRRRKSYED